MTTRKVVLARIVDELLELNLVTPAQVGDFDIELEEAEADGKGNFDAVEANIRAAVEACEADESKKRVWRKMIDDTVGS